MSLLWQRGGGEERYTGERVGTGRMDVNNLALSLAVKGIINPKIKFLPSWCLYLYNLFSTGKSARMLTLSIHRKWITMDTVELHERAKSTIKVAAPPSILSEKGLKSHLSIKSSALMHYGRFHIIDGRCFKQT